MKEENRSLPVEEWDKPMGSSSKEPLPFMPDREWLEAVIAGVDYRIAMMNGVVQYVKDMEGNEILDENGEKIQRKEFNFTFEIAGYSLPNGGARKGWVSLGASMGRKSHLPKFLENVGLVDQVNLTPKQIRDYCVGIRVKLQFANYRNAADEERQRIVWDSVRKI